MLYKMRGFWRERKNSVGEFCVVVVIGLLVAFGCFGAGAVAAGAPATKEAPANGTGSSNTGVVCIDLKGYDLRDIQSLADILAIAIATDTSVKLAEWEIRKAQAGLEGVSAGLRPQLTVAGEYKVENVANNSAVLGSLAEFGDSGTAQMSQMDYSSLLDDQLRTTSGSFTWYQQLLPNASLRGALDKARIGLEMGAIQKEETVLQLVTRVQDAYFQLLKAYDGVQVAEMALDHARHNVAVIKQKRAAGTATDLDVLKEKNRQMETENQVNVARMGLKMATLGLLQILDLDESYLSQAMDWAGELLRNQDVTPERWDVDLDRAVQYALTHRSDVRLAAQQLKLAEADYHSTVERRDWTVTLSGYYRPDDETILQGSVDSNWALTGTVAKTHVAGLPEVPGGGQVQNSGGGAAGSGVDPWQINLSLTYRFGDGGARRAETAAKQAAVEQARLQYNALRDGIYLTLYGKCEQLDQAWREYELARQAKAAAEATLAKLKQMYALGSVTKQDVLEGKLLVRQASNKVLSAGLDYEARKAKLAAAMGVDVQAFIRAVGTGAWDEVFQW